MTHLPDILFIGGVLDGKFGHDFGDEYREGCRQIPLDPAPWEGPLDPAATYTLDRSSYRRERLAVGPRTRIPFFVETNMSLEDAAYRLFTHYRPSP